MRKNKAAQKIINFRRFSETPDRQAKPPKKGIYLLPNVLTTGALFAGFYAVLSGFGGRYELAVIAIFAAMFFDGLDGRVARLTNTQSDFGLQYDSLSDMVSFGIAPAFVAYAWGLNNLGNLGVAAAFIYASCAALRLARFNVQSALADEKYFTGLPSPAAAALVAGFLWSVQGLEQSVFLYGLATLLTGTAGLLMVSNFKYPSFKGVDLRGKVPFVVILSIAMGFVVVSIDPPRILFLMAFSFAFLAPLLPLFSKLRGLKKTAD